MNLYNIAATEPEFTSDCLPKVWYHYLTCGFLACSSDDIVMKYLMHVEHGTGSAALP